MFVRYIARGRSQVTLNEMNDILKYHTAKRYDAGVYRTYMAADMGDLVVPTELGTNRNLFFNTISGVSFIMYYYVCQFLKPVRQALNMYKWSSA